MKLGRKFLISLLAGVLVGVSGTAAFAATTYSSWKNVGVISGVTQQNRGFVSSDTHAGGGSALADAVLPAGYLRVKGYLYLETAGCAVSALTYTSGSASGLTKSAVGNCGTGNYHGMALTWHYNGSGYDSFSSYNSPNLGW